MSQPVTSLSIDPSEQLQRVPRSTLKEPSEFVYPPTVIIPLHPLLHLHHVHALPLVVDTVHVTSASGSFKCSSCRYLGGGRLLLLGVSLSDL